MLLNKYEPFNATNTGEIDDSPATKALEIKKTLDFKQI